MDSGASRWPCLPPATWCIHGTHFLHRCSLVHRDACLRGTRRDRVTWQRNDGPQSLAASIGLSAYYTIQSYSPESGQGNSAARSSGDYSMTANMVATESQQCLIAHEGRNGLEHCALVHERNSNQKRSCAAVWDIVHKPIDPNMRESLIKAQWVPMQS